VSRVPIGTENFDLRFGVMIKKNPKLSAEENQAMVDTCSKLARRCVPPGCACLAQQGAGRQSDPVRRRRPDPQAAPVGITRSTWTPRVYRPRSRKERNM